MPLLLTARRTVAPPYVRPAGWESWPVKHAQGATTTTAMETISGNGGPLRVELPHDRAIAPLRIQGFTDLLVVGGMVRALPGSNLAGQSQRMIYLPEIFGVAHFEGVHLDATNVIGAETDGITFNGPTGTLRLRGCRITGLRGTQDGNHADLGQCWAGADEVDVDGLTGSTDYQGWKLQLTENEKARGRKINRITMSRVNIRGLVEAERAGIAATNGAHHLWFDPEPGTQGGPDVVLREVYSEGPQRLGFRVWPREDQPDRHGCTVVDGRATWPAAMKINGHVTDGPPPGGDFVPADRVGLAYPHRIPLQA